MWCNSDMLHAGNLLIPDVLTYAIKSMTRPRGTPIQWWTGACCLAMYTY
jgi:hypothetical protein